MLRRLLMVGNGGLAIAAGAFAGNLSSLGSDARATYWYLLCVAAVVLSGNLYYLGICRRGTGALPSPGVLIGRLHLDRLMDDRYVFAAFFLFLGALNEEPLGAFLALIVALLLEISGMIHRSQTVDLPTAAGMVWTVTLWSTVSYLVGRIGRALVAFL